MRMIHRLIVSLFAFLTFNANATDTYNHLNAQLSIPAVTLGDTVYRDVVITVGEVLTVGGTSSDPKYSAKPGSSFDTYDPVTNRLTIPNVKAFGIIYHDVVITVDKVVSVGSSESKGEDIACTERSSLQSLNAKSIYNFTGLTSNWANKVTIPGAENNEIFTIAFSNFSAIATERGDLALKSLLVSKLHEWAAAKAFQGSRLCWSVSKGWDSTCTQWVDPNGNDLSAIQDNNFIMEMVESLRRSYSLLSDWTKLNEPIKHSNIMEWLTFFDVNTPNPSNVFFGLGMGRYHWEIQRVKEKSGVSATIPLINQLMAGILPLINDDGSIVDRTTRGNRGMWYHYTSLNEIVTSIYLARDAGVAVNPLLESRLHKAVNLFLNTLDDPSYIIKWASVGFNNAGSGESQNFNFSNWYDEPYAGSWIYLYANWYPSTNNSSRLKKIVPFSSAKSSSQDRQFGVPLGCLLY